MRFRSCLAAGVFIRPFRPHALAGHTLSLALLAASLGGMAPAVQAASVSSVYGVKVTVGTGTAMRRDAHLFQIDPATNTLASGTIVPARLNSASVYLDGLAITSTGDLYGFVMDNATGTGDVGGLGAPATGSTASGNHRSQLVAVDPATGVLTPIGAQRQGAIHNGAAFNRADELWAVNYYAASLERIDPATGTVQANVPVTLPAGTPWPNSLPADLAFDVDDQAILTLGPDFFAVDLLTGATTPLANFPSQGFVALSYHRNNEAWVIEANGLDDVRYHDTGVLGSLGAVAGLEDLTALITGTRNSGTLDLASIPNRATAADDAFEVDVDSTGTPLDVLANDSNVRNWAMGIEVLSPPTQGTLNTSGPTPVYTPAPGYSGPDTFSYRTCTDPAGTCATATVTLTVRPAPPVVNPPTASVAPVPATGPAGLALLGLAAAWLGARRRTR